MARVVYVIDLDLLPQRGLDFDDMVEELGAQFENAAVEYGVVNGVQANVEPSDDGEAYSLPLGVAGTGSYDEPEPIRPGAMNQWSGR